MFDLGLHMNDLGNATCSNECIVSLMNLFFILVYLYVRVAMA
jgi:hypothetical protein